MTTSGRHSTIFLSSRKTGVLALWVATLMVVACLPAQAQTFSVIHNFTGTSDGNGPEAGLTMDAHGNLYGASSEGGTSCSCGAVFKLIQRGSGWTLAPLYNFRGGSDGSDPQAKVIIGPNGTLYGTTFAGGQGSCSFGAGCGTVFNLQPPAHAPASPLALWTKRVLYRFAGGADGGGPGPATLIFDSAVNLYGTTEIGGANDGGTIYKLTATNGGWTKTEIYSFVGSQDGSHPMSGVVFDHAGNLYGTTSDGGPFGFGTVYQLTPSGSGWVEHTLHAFSGGSDGVFPWAGLLFDGGENFYGTTTANGAGNAGTVFKLTSSNGSWTYTEIHSFTRSEGASPVDTPVMDAQGNLYGTTLNGGANNIGTVFKLTPSGGNWTFTSLHSFSGSDGNSPFGSPVLDATGNLYGTSFFGGSHGLGDIFKIAP